MKLFRRFKYRLRRFIISFISILSIVCMSVIPAYADVLSVSDSGLNVTVQPYVWNGSDGWDYDNRFLFLPGTEYNSTFAITGGEAFGLTFDVSSNDSSHPNGLSLSTGMLHFSISFLTNAYFTSRIPYLNFTYIDESSSPPYPVNYTIESDKFTYSSGSVRHSGSGASQIFLFTCDIYIDTKYLSSFDASSFYFYLQRDTAAASISSWYLNCETFVMEILTGADIPKYSQPDTSAKNELDSVEGELNDSINSFGSDIGSIFSFDDLGELVVPGITFWGTTLEDFFNLDFVRPILILSLACGIFALLFGLVGTLVSRSNTKQSQSKSSKSKGG